MASDPKLQWPSVSMLPSGFLTLPEHFFCADQADKTVCSTVPSMSFLVQHRSKRIVFDLGMRKVLENYPADIHPHLATRQPIETVPDASDSLRAGNLSPDDMDVVILSHVHYDHVGTPSDFGRADFVVGHGVRHLLRHGMNYHSAAKFDKDLLPADRTIELPAQTRPPGYAHAVRNNLPPTERTVDAAVPAAGPANRGWKPLDVFENAMDLFGDGLVYVVDSPGHLVGHLNLLVRVGPVDWIYLAGDACHHARLLDGETGFARWEENGVHVCIHTDGALAEDTLRRIRQARAEGILGSGAGSVEVVFAHDLRWYRDHQDAVFPGVFRGSSSAE